MEEQAPKKDVSHETTRVDLRSVQERGIKPDEAAYAPTLQATPSGAPTARPVAPEPDAYAPTLQVVPDKVRRLSASDRLADILEKQKKKSRKGFLFGLIAGQLLVVGLSLGGGTLLELFKDKIKVNAPICLEALVFIGMSAGILLTGLLIAGVLGLQGVGWLFGKKKPGGVGRGVGRVMKGMFSVGITFLVIGGTAWALIPKPEWKPTALYLRDQGLKGYEAARDWTEKLLKPPADFPAPPSDESPK